MSVFRENNKKNNRLESVKVMVELKLIKYNLYPGKTPFDNPREKKKE